MFDLTAYLARLDLPEAPAADVEGLAALQRAHRLAIPFENLDVKLGRGVAIDSASVFDKLVTRRRGGYCFEQNRLLLDALAAIGFTARPLLARVWLGMTEPQPLTHTLSLVTIDGREWIADAGFGGSYAPILPLEDGAEAEAPDGSRHRLERHDDYGWMLLRAGVPVSTTTSADQLGWQQQYSFDLRTVYDADLAAGNWWTSTAPESRFTQLVIASIVLPFGFATLVDRNYRRHSSEGTTSGEITDPRVYRIRMSLMFGIDLTVEEIAELALF
ncbi:MULTISPECIES: arylamine N-acetyltransferase [Sphingomonas]|uniref:arylamine N-acetyltransferase family protein n=1 Tax=Sphingomonas TaxID=13687 RepID=UPI00092C1909|nr:MULTISPECIES: arylamine N-acetyltransferase [Sphingomonas]MCW6529402.1 arylamine N-acetyltransferase [Sphingomonas lycopersici]OJU19289.1 MAG: acetyltransferase [Sphingomonas sp. 66-10]